MHFKMVFLLIITAIFSTWPIYSSSENEIKVIVNTDTSRIDSLYRILEKNGYHRLHNGEFVSQISESTQPIDLDGIINILPYIGYAAAGLLVLFVITKFIFLVVDRFRDSDDEIDNEIQSFNTVMRQYASMNYPSQNFQNMQQSTGYERYAAYNDQAQFNFIKKGY